MKSNEKKDPVRAAQIAAAADIPTGEYIPYSTPMSASVMKLRQNGDMCATWRLNGVAFETAGIEQIASAKRQLVSFVHAVRSTDMAEPTAIWVHRVRRRMTDRLPGEFDNLLSQRLDDEYWDKVGKKRMLRSELYFTLVVRPSLAAGGLLKKLSARSADELIQRDQEALARFEVLCGQVDASMRKYGGGRLAAYEKTTSTGNVVILSPQLSFYNYLLSGVWEDVPLQAGPVYDYLCESRLFAGEGNGIVQMNHPRRRTYVGYVDLMDYPAVTEPGMNNCLFQGDYEFCETQSFSFLSKRDGVAALDLQQKRLVSSGEGSPEQIGDLNAAMEDVRNGRVFMGEYHYTLGVMGASLSETQANMCKARTALQEEAGFKVATVDLVPACAHLAQLPGNWTMRPREAKITSRNFASLAPLHNFDLGKRNSNPWGDAITMFDTPSLQPYYFNFHDTPLGHDSTGAKADGNTFICGMTGTGKSVLLGVLLNQAKKVRKLRILFFDKDRGGEIMIRAMGGRYRQLKRGAPTGFNPFQWTPTASTIKFVKDLVIQCALRGEEIELDAHLENKLTEAIDRVFALPDKAHRRISAILQFVGDTSELGQRLSKWCRTASKIGSNAWVLDNATDTTNFSGCSVFGFDYTEFLDDHECGPVILSYILEAANTLLNGDPFIYVMEEFAKMVNAKSQTLVEFARDKQTTIRKQRGLGMFVTQSPSQVNEFPIGATLREQCGTHIYLPNPGADAADYIDGFKVSPSEFALIRELPKDSRMFLVKQGQRSALCRLDLGGMEDVLDLISGSLDSVLYLDQLRFDLKSDDPAVWVEPFLRHMRSLRAGATLKKAA